MSPAWAGAAPVILVMGDSLSAAYGMAQNQGWVSLLKQRLAEHDHAMTVVNASISGETTRGGRTRLAQHLHHHTPAIVILQLGGNDGLRGIALDEMQENLAAMIRQAHAHQAQVLLVGVDLPPNYGPVFTQRFAAVYQTLAQNYTVDLVPSLLADVAENWDLMQADGIHPTAEAQPLMLDTVWAALSPQLALLHPADTAIPTH
ncbi:arylesterase [Thiorhodospira sibirica]|uniref:arylesterase n=1 Tax=Thiorhodospira sibirica TaxID=154347 RepID=UPI00022C0BA2|nr:arylesterase [Thiorhodospira sibirica]